MKVSVIIPVYKAERFIARCLDSLLAQTHTDWEAVCVDDGSPDGSGEILDAYSRSDSRIKAIHISNSGVSVARNTAIEAASGDYVLFVDADDFLHPQTMELTLSRAVSDGSDIVAFTYNRRYHTRLTVRQALHIPDPRKLRFKKYEADAIEALVTEKILHYATEYSHPSELEFDPKWLVKHCQPWRCLYKMDVVKELKFIQGIIYEDFPWWGEVLKRTKRASILNLPLYYYYPNFKSYIHSSSQNFRIESLKIALQAAEKVFEKGTDDYTLWDEKFLVPFRGKLAKKIERNN